ncbi:ATP-binding protein [Saccharicrinis sp. FJH54]|uniref:ATP-binding protein n=1 Tax=Saccharicrinis sp. FJH54 TaxID=3344665 RepID=UPI0035D50311
MHSEPQLMQQTGYFNKVLKTVEQAIDNRMQHEFGQQAFKKTDLGELKTKNSFLGKYMIEHKLSDEEILCLLIAFIPHLSPHFYAATVQKYFPGGGDFPEFGGVKGKNHRGVLPTGETVQFILAGRDIEKRIAVLSLFEPESILIRHNILYVNQGEENEPGMSGVIVLSDEYIDLFTKGRITRPKLSSGFPAEYITTTLEWKDLVLQKSTLDEIREIETWLAHNNEFLKKWKMEGKIKPGFRALFHGPPGTGKTLTACLLGKYTGNDVFRIDLSMVVSKYIGETEKNLSRLFDKAANKDWILFFDEADAIFGKRTNIRDAHDKYANQEVSYLLQRIEAHPGLVILASNQKSNIDFAFTRRFNTIVEFENPGVAERIQLWKTYIPGSVKLDPEISLEEIARKYDITGANILNVVHYAGLRTIEGKSGTLRHRDLIDGIKKEYIKEGKMIRNRKE